MDELQVVRELLTERPPPRPEAIARARARLSQPLPRRWAPPRGRLALRVGVPVAMAMTAIAGIAAITFPGPAGPSPAVSLGLYHPPAGPGQPPGPAGSGRAILLAAARTAGRTGQGATTGGYWQNSSLVGNFLRVGPPSNRYLILERTALQSWMTRDPRRLSQVFLRKLGVEAASAADRRAWIRDGSPASWDIGQESDVADQAGYSSGNGEKVQAGRSGLVPVFGESGGPFVLGGRSYSAQGLLALPADPARLKALLLAGYRPGTSDGSPEDYLFEVTPSAFTLPVTPQVRSALYRMLAGLPGIRSLGQVRDATGQPGVAVALDSHQTHCGHWSQPGSGSDHWTFSACDVQQRLVIDPATGSLLSLELRYLRLPPGQSWPAPSGLFSYDVFGAAHWTSVGPPTGDN